MENIKLSRVELHCHTKMSQKAGLYDAGEIISKAIDLGMDAVAVTDIDSVQAFPDAYRASKSFLGYKIIYGLEISVELENGTFPVVLLVQNETGRKNLYKLLSKANMEYYRDMPILPKRVLDKHREGIIIGSAGADGCLYRAFLMGDADRVCHMAEWFDYLEIVPEEALIGALKERQISDQEKAELSRGASSEIVKLGQRFHIPVCAASDAYYLNKEDVDIYKVLRHGYDDYKKDCCMSLLSTDEMLSEFAWLGEDKAMEVVVTNTQRIADRIENISPLSEKRYIPAIDNSEIQKLTADIYNEAHRKYGKDDLPSSVISRLDDELKVISDEDYLSFWIAMKQVEYSKSKGYPVTSRGCVAASLAAYFLGITGVNPLPAHYYCSEDSYFEYAVQSENKLVDLIYQDMPDKVCPHCGKPMHKDGYNIVPETFFGLNGNKKIDIDLNFSGEIQSEMVSYTSRILKQDRVCRAGTIATIAWKHARGLVDAYYTDENDPCPDVSVDEINGVVDRLTGIKRDTGINPGKYLFIPNDEEIFEYTPIEYCVPGDETSGIKTHFDWHTLETNFIDMDILGHDNPTILRMLSERTGVELSEINFDSGLLKLPDFSSDYFLEDINQTHFQNWGEFVKAYGLEHGTGVFSENVELIENGTATMSEVIAFRDDIYIYLLKMGIDKETAYTIMEATRKGRYSGKWDEILREHNVPEWYTESLKKIKYLFPKSHAVSYSIAVMKMLWFKANYPETYQKVCMDVKLRSLPSRRSKQV